MNEEPKLQGLYCNNVYVEYNLVQ